MKAFPGIREKMDSSFSLNYTIGLIFLLHRTWLLH